MCITHINYGAEIWATFQGYDFHSWDISEIEKVGMQFCKRLLGVNRSTQNNISRAELGRFPLKTIIDRQFISFMNHIKRLHKDSLAYQAYILDNNLDRYNLITANKQFERMTVTYENNLTEISKSNLKKKIIEFHKS